MIVPSIAELERAFGSSAISMAEVGIGRFLGLDRWPEGEIRLSKVSAGRSVTLCVNPAAGLVSVDLETLDPAVRIEMSEVTELRIKERPRSLALHQSDGHHAIR